MEIRQIDHLMAGECMLQKGINLGIVVGAWSEEQHITNIPHQRANHTVVQLIQRLVGQDQAQSKFAAFRERGSNIRNGEILKFVHEQLAELTSNKRLLGSIVQAKSEIAQMAIEEWKKRELKKAKDNPAIFVQSSLKTNQSI